MTALDYIFWGIEFLLEAFGARLAYRKRIAPLWIYLGFRAIADIACFVILRKSGAEAYAWADYSQRLVQTVLFGILTLYAAAVALKADQHTKRFYSVAAGIVAVFAIYFFHQAPLTMGRIRGFEIVCSLGCAAFLALAIYYGQAQRLWKQIAHGLFLIAFSDGALAFCDMRGIYLESWYPAAIIFGLGWLSYSVLRRGEEDGATHNRSVVNTVVPRRAYDSNCHNGGISGETLGAHSGRSGEAEVTLPDLSEYDMRLARGLKIRID